MGFKMVFTPVFVGLILVVVQATGACQCEKYQEMEKKLACGVDGYVMKYGFPYCARFFQPEYYSWFDQAGKDWVTCTGNCLLEKTGEIVEKVVAENSQDCEAVEDAAFEFHNECYHRCNFCNACKTNKLALLHVFDLNDFFYAKAFNQAYEIATMCSNYCLI